MNQQKLHRLLVLAAMILPAPAFAGGSWELGNGGNVVRCSQGSHGPELFGPTKLAVLDLYEGARWQQATYHELRSLRPLPWPRAFERLLDRFLSRSPERLARYRTWFARFPQESEFSESELPLAFEARFPLIGRSCRSVQAIIQHTPFLPTRQSTRLQISLPVWRQLESDQRAALLLHEYVLREMLFLYRNCHVADVRRQVGFVLSDQALDVPAAAWNERFAPATCDDGVGN